jgi:hypothetical protein
VCSIAPRLGLSPRARRRARSAKASRPPAASA